MDLEKRVLELERRVLALTAYIDAQWQGQMGRPFDGSIKMPWPGDVRDPDAVMQRGAG